MDLSVLKKKKTNCIKSSVEYIEMLNGEIQTRQIVSIGDEDIAELQYNYKEDDMKELKRNEKEAIIRELSDINNDTSWYLEKNKKGKWILKHKKLKLYLWAESLELVKDTVFVGVTAIVLWKLKNVSKSLGTECWDSIRQAVNKIKAV